MKIVFFSSQPYDKQFFTQFNQQGYELIFHESALNEQSVNLAAGANAICVFVNDKVNANIIAQLAKLKVGIIALRCAGFNNVDLEAARTAGIKVCRVPAYSPEAVAEHAVAMLLTLNRKTHKAYIKVRSQQLIHFRILRQHIAIKQRPNSNPVLIPKSTLTNCIFNTSIS